MTETIPDEVIEKMAYASLERCSPCKAVSIHAALKAAEAAGWVMVPTEATEQMQDEYARRITSAINEGRRFEPWVEGYRAMIAARPKVP